MKKLIIVSLFSLVIGCGGKHSEHCSVYHFHPSYPNEYKPQTIEAVNMWNLFADEKVRIIGLEGDSISLEEESEIDCSFRSIPWGGSEWNDIRSEEGKDFMAYAHGKDRSIIITSGEYTNACVINVSNCILGTMEHELGHAHGMNHLYGHDVMNPTYIVTEYSENDRLECRNTGACK